MIRASRSPMLDVGTQAQLRALDERARTASGLDIPAQICDTSGEWLGVFSAIGDAFIVTFPVTAIEAEPGTTIIASVQTDTAPKHDVAPRVIGQTVISGAGTYQIGCSLPIEELIRAQSDGLWLATTMTIAGGAASVKYGAFILPGKLGAGA